MSSAGQLTRFPEVGSGVREMMAAAALVPNAVHLEVGQPDWEPPEAVREAAARAVHGSMRYTPSLGIPALRERIAARTAERTGLPVNADMVAVTPGAVCAVAALVVLRSGPEAPLLVPDATWPNYLMMPDLSGAQLVRYPLVDDLPDVDFLESLGHDSALLVLNTPANPTGAVADESLVGRLVALAESRGWFVLADEIYEDLVWRGKPARAAALAGSFSRVGVVSGVSKSFGMTGYRLGWLVAEPELVRRVETVLETLVSCASGSSQDAAVAALDADPAYLDAVRAQLAGRADALAAACAGHDVLSRAPTAGLYAWLRLGERAGDGRRFAYDLLEAESIAVAPGSAFGPGGAGHVRLALAVPPETLGPAAEKLVAFWRIWK